MARRKKSKRTRGSKKVAAKENRLNAPEGFWSQATSVILILLAILVTFGSFNAGGPLSVKMFEWSRWLVGVVAFSLPFALLAAAVIKIRSDDSRLPRMMFWGFLILYLTAAGFAHLFIDRADSLAAVDSGMGGGLIGHITATGILGVLNKVTGGIVLFVLAVIALHFVLRLPLTHLFKLSGLKRKPPSEDEEETQKQVKNGFTLNEGVPVQRGKPEASPKAEVGQGALTTIGDPDWNFPPLELLNDAQDKADAGDIDGIAEIIKNTLSEFGIEVEMQGANVGPRVTQYTLSPPSGVRLTKITALENNLALNLAATAIRMEAPIPGKRAVGIEVPNQKMATVRLHSILDSDEWRKNKDPLAFAIGKDISGAPIVGELDNMPHLLIAGATNSGKSVMINSLLVSLLYRNSPSDMKLILVDPKEVELVPFNDIPHLLTPVITEPKKCVSALQWASAEMDRRYKLLKEAGRKNIQGYNALKKEEGMPYIVIVIDELHDLMHFAAREVEALIVRLAAKARAVGIHLVLATQRPSVDVITGTIKANIPARIAFTVTDQVNSRTILDQGGAEKLLGRGDMLMLTPEITKAKRVQGSIVEEKEVEKVTDFLRMESAPEYDDEIVTQQVNIGGGGGGGLFHGEDGGDELYEDAVQAVVDSGKASTSLLQRRLRIGYSRAARIMEALEEQGVVGPADGSRPREVLISSVDEANLGFTDTDEEPFPDEPDDNQPV